MNKKHTNLFKKLLWIMCLVALLILYQAPQVMAAGTEEVTVVVSTLPDLIIAIENAQDGDVIGIKYGLNISNDAVIGNPDKQVILKRMDEVSLFYVNDRSNILFQNVIFDGSGISSQYPFVRVNNNVTFENTVFKNCVSASAGGALKIDAGEVIFTNCLFENNRAIAGGHIAINSEATVNIENCILKSGYAVSKGGAIFNSAASSTCNITSSIITGNEAGDFGGGVVNFGAMTITGTKLYDNLATNGGADIGNTGWLSLEDSIEALVDLFKDTGIVPTGWVNDYDFEAGIFIPDIDPLAPNSLLKLAYEIPISEPTTVILDAESLGVAGDGKISGLESGKYYKVIKDGVLSYVKSDGTLTANESEAGILIGTEIIGLTNGITYKVEEYTAVEPEEPTPTPDPEEEPGQDDQQPEEPGQDQENPQPTPEPEEDDQQPDPTPTPTPTPRPSSNSGSSHSHNSNTTKPVVKVETKPAVILSYGKAVLDTTKTEYLLGYADGLLGNKGTVTRAELVQIVYRLLTPESKASVYSNKNSFKDVAVNAWYNEAVSTMLNAGLISIGADKKFNPDKNVTWGEMVSILAKFAKPNFEWKIITRHWAKDALNTAISYRWFEYNDQFNPDGEVTRLEMLNFINTMFDWATKNNQ